MCKRKTLLKIQYYWTGLSSLTFKWATLRTRTKHLVQRTQHRCSHTKKIKEGLINKCIYGTYATLPARHIYEMRWDVRQCFKTPCPDKKMTFIWTQVVSQICSYWFICFPLNIPLAEKKRTEENKRTVKCTLIPAGDDNPVQRQQGNGLVRGRPSKYMQMRMIILQMSRKMKTNFIIRPENSPR